MLELIGYKLWIDKAIGVYTNSQLHEGGLVWFDSDPDVYAAAHSMMHRIDRNGTKVKVTYEIAEPARRTDLGTLPAKLKALKLEEIPAA